MPLLFKRTIIILFYLPLLLLSTSNQQQESSNRPLHQHHPCQVEEEVTPTDSVVCYLDSVWPDIDWSSDAVVVTLISEVDLNRPRFRLELSSSTDANSSERSQSSPSSRYRLIAGHGRLDREQLIASKSCYQQVCQTVNEPSCYKLYASVDANQIHCFLLLELALTSRPPLLSKGRQSFESSHRPLLRILHLPVLVTDINDHWPQFGEQVGRPIWLRVDEDNDLEAGLYENGVGGQRQGQLRPIKRRLTTRRVGSLPLASDYDYGPNGTIVYGLEGPDAAGFKLVTKFSPISPSIIDRLDVESIEWLDYEVKSQFHFTLSARDQSWSIHAIGPHQQAQSPSTTAMPKVGRLQLIVQLQPINEFWPEFDLGDSRRNLNNTTTITIREDIRPGSRIFQAKAHDRDLKIGSFKSHNPKRRGVKFALATKGDSTRRSIGPAFLIDPTTGWISWHGNSLPPVNLDHHRDGDGLDDTLILKVLAIDSGEPPKTSTLSIEVQIEHVNELRPVIKVSALLSNSKSKNAIDQGRVLTVDENSPPGTLIGKISAIDSDYGSAGLVSCTIDQQLIEHSSSTITFQHNQLQPELFDLILISPAVGELTSNSILGHRNPSYLLATANRPSKMLDRELIKSCQLEIKCTDHGSQRQLSTRRLIDVFIGDVNDEQPHFTNRRFYFNVNEDLVGGAIVGKVVALDRDLDGLETTRYSIKPDNPFTINSRTGWIKLSDDQLLDRESIDKYQLSVTTFDAEHTNQSSDTALVQINILDINDNPPILIDVISQYKSNSSESITANNTTLWLEEEPGNQSRIPGRLLLAYIKATDADLGINSHLTFSLINPDADSHQWFVDSTNGSLFAKFGYHRFRLDRETQTFHKIGIRITDHGVNPLTSTCTITLSLIDLNDNCPKFVRPPTTSTRNSSNALLMIDANATSGTLIYTVEAVDLDLGSNGQVRYELVQLNRTNTSRPYYFAIDHKTGQIRLTRRINYSRPSLLLIKAYDLGEPLQLSSFVTLSVKLHQEDEEDQMTNYTDPPTAKSANDIVKLPPSTSERRLDKVATSQLDQLISTKGQGHFRSTSPLINWFGIGLIVVVLSSLLLLFTYALRVLQLHRRARRKRDDDAGDGGKNDWEKSDQTNDDVGGGSVKRMTPIGQSCCSSELQSSKLLSNR